MVESTNGEQPISVLLIPNPGDLPERKDSMNRNVNDMDDLIELGFIRDISDAFKQQIEQSVAVKNRSYRVLIPTDIGFKMFQELAGRSIN